MLREDLACLSGTASPWGMPELLAPCLWVRGAPFTISSSLPSLIPPMPAARCPHAAFWVCFYLAVFALPQDQSALPLLRAPKGDKSPGCSRCCQKSELWSSHHIGDAEEEGACLCPVCTKHLNNGEAGALCGGWASHFPPQMIS